MKAKNKIISIAAIAALALALSVAFWGKGAVGGKGASIVIFYENDVHCAIDGYAQLAAVRDAERNLTPYVTTVSCGDFVQGNTTGSLSQGEYIIDIMNAVGYDVVTIGNHEFDYSVPQMKHLMERLNAEVVCCNLSGTTEGDIFPPYTIKKYGRTRVAYIGAATPTTFNTSTPTYFQDSLGNVVYSFHKDDTYDRIQAAADEARRKGADYVILLSHLGDDTDGWNSRDCISRTHGIDVVLDGHSHNVLMERLPNDLGDSILLTSTGTVFRHIGKLTITPDGNIKPELITPPSLPSGEETLPSEGVSAVISDVRERLAERVNAVVGYTPFELTHCDNRGERIVRNAETNLGDFLTDAMRTMMHTDIAMANGGGIRTRIPAGDITMGALYAVWPFNNTIRVIRGTGLQIMDALEVGARTYPAEDGNFMHVSGLRYRINPAIPSSVQMDENSLFTGVGGARRIVEVEVMDSCGNYQPIDPEREYTVAAQSYIGVAGGSNGALSPLTEIASSMPGDIDILVNYIHSLGDTIPAHYATADGRIMVK